MEEDPSRRLHQKEFSSRLVKSLCGTFKNRIPTGPPFAVPLPLVRSPGHDISQCVTKERKMPSMCMGPSKKVRTETVFGCLRCRVQLCRDKCHDLYHASLALNSPK